VTPAKKPGARGGAARTQGTAGATPPGAVPASLRLPLGQGPELARLLVLARARRMPHGILVSGGAGCGKTTVVRWLAAALLCPSELDHAGPCGACRTCRRIAREQHPDVHVLRRARDEAEKEAFGFGLYGIGVGQVRTVQDALGLHAVEGRARVLHVHEADLLEEEAQNALLKTLEEPGQDTFVLLETARPERLLPTIRSRVQRLAVRPLGDDAVRAELARLAPERSAHFDRAVALARGSVGRALLSCTEQAVQLQDLVQRLVATSQGLRPWTTTGAVLEGAQGRADKQARARLFLSLLRGALHERAVRLAAAGGIPYPAAQSEPWTSLAEITLAAEQDLELQVPPEQALCGCLVQFGDHAW
jgi:DNA polymerase-3 subunit delta'